MKRDNIRYFKVAKEIGKGRSEEERREEAKRKAMQSKDKSNR